MSFDFYGNENRVKDCFFAGCSKRSANEAAGKAATEAYAFRYAAGRRLTENEVGGRFQHPARSNTGTSVSRRWHEPERPGASVLQ